MAIVHLTDKNFEKEVLKSKTPVLVDFWAEWCMPCKMIAPILDEIFKEYSGRLKIAKINIDEGQNTATKYGIMSIPTLMFFKNGVVSDQVVGALTREQLIKKIQDNL
ncbi:MAG: thioredoxin [Candidatus Omnitrophota bacterium]